MDALITVEGVEKDFGNQVKALDQINLEIASGDIYGIIGMSGAGKSTLVRCLNYLEKPTAGVVKIHGKDLSTLKGRQLRKERQKIAMIFQHFNLMPSRTVAICRVNASEIGMGPSAAETSGSQRSLSPRKYRMVS